MAHGPDPGDRGSKRKFVLKSLVSTIQEVLVCKKNACILRKGIQKLDGVDMQDKDRKKITKQIEKLTKDLVEAQAIYKLSQNSTPEARGTLLRFAKMLDNVQNKTMEKDTGEATLNRQEYLAAFEECIRFIPCWVMTTHQVPDYLLPHFDLFDLVVIDEASQCDISVLPVLLRGKQWLVVGDIHQGGPRESFVTDTRLDNPGEFLFNSPFRSSFFSGNSKVVPEKVLSRTPG